MPRTIQFPAGEVTVRVTEDDISDEVTIHLHFRSYATVFQALSAANAIRHAQPLAVISLVIPYFPSSRQDRVTGYGHAFDAQVMAKVLLSGEFDTITTYDAHSDVLGALFPPGMFKNIPQWDLLSPFVETIEQPVLISPDAGAEKKTRMLAEKIKRPMILATKLRDTETGALSGTEIGYYEQYDHQNMVIVDDICDGGGTFILLAKAIRQSYTPKSLSLVVTHGIFSKGKEVLEKEFDTVYALNDFTASQENTNV